MLSKSKVALAGATLATVMFMVACGGDDEPANGSSSGSMTSSSGGGSSSGANASSSGSSATTLYDRLGKKDGIRSALELIVAEELKDPEVASFFFRQAGAPANGSPTPAAIIECLTNQLGAAAGGPAAEVVYPTTVANGSGMHTCRDMNASHAGLGIYSSVFDKFVGIAGGVLTAAGVDPADINVVAGVLVGTKGDIVDSQRTDDAGFQDGAP